MRIIDLLQEASIDLHGPAGDKQTALAHLAALMAKGGNLADTDAYLQAVLARETEGSTGIGEGIAIPHAKTAAVKTPGLAVFIIIFTFEADLSISTSAIAEVFHFFISSQILVEFVK